jgi:hypothetical protein
MLVAAGFTMTASLASGAVLTYGTVADGSGSALFPNLAEFMRHS